MSPRLHRKKYNVNIPTMPIMRMCDLMQLASNTASQWDRNSPNTNPDSSQIPRRLLLPNNIAPCNTA